MNALVKALNHHAVPVPDKALDGTDYSKAVLMMTMMPGAFIGGSYLVDPDKANDIDVVVSSSVWQLVAQTVLDAYGPSEMRFAERKEEYEGNPDVQEIHYFGRVNLIVATEEMIAAYKAAAREMKNNPELYPTRHDRIELHQHYKRQIRQWLGL